MKISILLYENVTALDAIGPYEVLHLMPDAEVRFVARTTGPVRTDAGLAMLNADTALDDATARPDKAPAEIAEAIREQYSIS